jgi:hypothetical protein
VSQRTFFPSRAIQIQTLTYERAMRNVTVTVVPHFLALGFVCPLIRGFQPFRGDLCCFCDIPISSSVCYIVNILASIRFHFLPFNSAACCSLYSTFALLSFVPPVPTKLFSCSRVSSVQSSESLRSISMLFLTHRLVGF